MRAASSLIGLGAAILCLVVAPYNPIIGGVLFFVAVFGLFGGQR